MRARSTGNLSERLGRPYACDRSNDKNELADSSGSQARSIKVKTRNSKVHLSFCNFKCLQASTILIVMLNYDTISSQATRILMKMLLVIVWSKFQGKQFWCLIGCGRWGTICVPRVLWGYLRQNTLYCVLYPYSRISPSTLLSTKKEIAFCVALLMDY